MLLRKLESAKNSLNVQVSPSSVTAAANTKKPVSFLRSWWNALTEDDQPSWNQVNQESDPTKCVDMITKTQQHLRQFFQLTVSNLTIIYKMFDGGVHCIRKLLLPIHCSNNIHHLVLTPPLYIPHPLQDCNK